MEGYPHEISDKKMSSSFLYNGTRSLHERVGFEYVRSGLKAYPTTQVPYREAATPKSCPKPGLVTCLHCLPFQCNVLGCCPPAAPTS